MRDNVLRASIRREASRLRKAAFGQSPKDAFIMRMVARSLDNILEDANGDK